MSPPFRTPRKIALTQRCWRQVFLAILLPATGSTARAVPAPASKVYVADVHGQAVIDNGEKITELSRRSVYRAEGTIIETKPIDAANQVGKAYSTLVYSNGTAAYFDPDTRLELKRFLQEPFTPTRTDFDVEPSISRTQALLTRGTIGLCTSKLVAGSSMVYQTPHAAVTILGRKVVIEAGPLQTKISMLDGESTVRAGPLDQGGHTVRAGHQAVITRNAVGQPSEIRIGSIPESEMRDLNDKVTRACMAKRTVYFDVREPGGDADGMASESQASDSEATANGAQGVVRAFYGSPAGSSGATPEIVAVPLVPANLPVPFVVSPAQLTAPRR